MITSNSTFKEIEAQKAIDEPLIQEFLTNKIARDAGKLKRIFKMKGYYTPTHPATYHSHATNIHWRILQILMHGKRTSALERAQGLNFGVESENTIKYTIINDLDTGQPLLVLPFPLNALFVSTHAIRRYRERALSGEDLDFTETCDRLIRRSPSYVFTFSHTIYGTTTYPSIVYRIADGMFLGYYNKDRGVIHLETFISVDMLNNNQKAISAYRYNDQLLRDQRDMVLGLIPYDAELSDSMNRSNVSAQKDGQFRELTPEEVDELIRVSKDEYDAIPKEEIRKRIAEEQEANRKRYVRKMLLKGYK